MRILLLSSAPAVSGKRIGGTIVWCQVFVRMMRKMGHQVYIVTYGNECALLDCAEFSRDLFFVAYKSSLSRIDSELFSTVPRMLNAAKKAVKIVKEKDINIILTARIHEAAGFYLFNPGVPVFSFCHAYYPYELDLWFDGKRRWPRLLAYWLLARLAKMVIRGVLYPSIWLKDKLAKRLGGIPGYIMGYARREQTDEGIPYSRESFGISNDKPVVISYNPMTAPHNKKSFELYLRVVKKIISEKRAAQYVLFGVKKEAAEFVTKAINGLPIKIITPVENIFKVLSLADIYFHVSLIDSFSFMTIEAMSLGLPVVATNRGALPERIEHGKTGILVEAEPESIAKAMVTILDDQRLRDRLGKAAREYIAKGYYSEATVGKVLADFLDSKSKY